VIALDPGFLKPHLRENMCTGHVWRDATTFFVVPHAKSAVHAKLSPVRADEFGTTVRTLRGRERMTQEALAASAGLSIDMIKRTERGVSNPTLATVCALADALRVAPARLIPH
jgi:DNA-binding XRE family transcriptional regulator